MKKKIKIYPINNLKEQIALGEGFVQANVNSQTKYSEQRYVLGKCLRDCLHISESDYPFAVEDYIETNKSPDCVLCLESGRRIGLELTEAVNQYLREAEARLDKQIPSDQIWNYKIKNYNPESGDNVEEIIDVIQKSQINESDEMELIFEKRTTGQGISGNAAEELVAKIIIDAIRKKSGKRKNWTIPVDDARLGIVVNPAFKAFDRPPICGMVVEELKRNEFKIPFSAIYLTVVSKKNKFAEYIGVEDGVPEVMNIVEP